MQVQEEHISGLDANIVQMQSSHFVIEKSLSVILPVYNEEAIIARTIQAVQRSLLPLVEHFEIIAVDDGSCDSTPQLLDTLAKRYVHLHVIHHDVNHGYGAALATGFAAAQNDFVFFMDSDGQFDIQEIIRFFPLLDEYDAVLGYRMNRQDSIIRKVNAWGWNFLVRSAFHLHVQDIDCAFKLYRGEFFRSHLLETKGAMINTEILYKYICNGYTYTEVGVRHLPRLAGKATGAKLSVVIRAFYELCYYTWKWRIRKQF